MKKKTKKISFHLYEREWYERLSIGSSSCLKSFDNGMKKLCSKASAKVNL